VTGAPEMARCDLCGELHPVARMVTAHKQPEEIPADARRDRPAPHEVLSIDYSDEELGFPQGQWPIVDRAVLDDDRAPDVVVRYESPRGDEAETWWMLLHQSGSGPAEESAGLLTDRFPGLAEPLRAGAGVWDLAGGERESARWRRVGEDELAGGEWPGLFRWLERTVGELRPR
jgi:hypothetical protein